MTTLPPLRLPLSRHAAHEIDKLNVNPDKQGIDAALVWYMFLAWNNKFWQKPNPFTDYYLLKSQYGISDIISGAKILREKKIIDDYGQSNEMNDFIAYLMCFGPILLQDDPCKIIFGISAENIHYYSKNGEEVMHIDNVQRVLCNNYFVACINT